MGCARAYHRDDAHPTLGLLDEINLWGLVSAMCVEGCVKKEAEEIWLRLSSGGLGSEALLCVQQLQPC